MATTNVTENSVVAGAVTVTEFFTPDDDLCDVVFIVEDTPVCFNRTLLMVCSPVFTRMFTADFYEKTQRTIPLPVKEIDSFTAFLRLIHPAHSIEQLSDSDLQPLLELAEEYDVAHVRSRCIRHLRDRTQSPLELEHLMPFLWLTSAHSLGRDLQDLLVTLASADHSQKELEQSPFFSLLDEDVHAELTKRRGQLHGEEEKERTRLLVDTGRVIHTLSCPASP